MSFNNIYISLYFFASFFALIAALEYDVKKVIVPGINKIGVICIVFSLVILFGTRGEEIGSDTNAYVYQFINVNNLEPDREIGFYYLVKILHNFIDAQLFIFLIAFLYLFTLFVYVMGKPQKINKYLYFYVFFSMFFFKTLGINVIRQGLSLVIFLISYQQYQQKNFKKFALFYFLAVGFHTTTLLAFPFMLLSSKISVRLTAILFLTTIVISYLNFGLLDLSPILSSFNTYDKRIDIYMTNETQDLYRVGFKIQFVIFNSFFFFFSQFIKDKVISKDNLEYLKTYDTYIIYFGLTSVLFFLCFQIPYSDRIGLLSWIVIPLLLEPIFDVNSRIRLATVSCLGCSILFIVFEFLL